MVHKQLQVCCYILPLLKDPPQYLLTTFCLTVIVCFWLTSCKDVCSYCPFDVGPNNVAIETTPKKSTVKLANIHLCLDEISILIVDT